MVNERARTNEALLILLPKSSERPYSTVEFAFRFVFQLIVALSFVGAAETEEILRAGIRDVFVSKVTFVKFKLPDVSFAYAELFVW